MLRDPRSRRRARRCLPLIGDLCPSGGHFEKPHAFGLCCRRARQVDTFLSQSQGVVARHHLSPRCGRGIIAVLVVERSLALWNITSVAGYDSPHGILDQTFTSPGSIWLGLSFFERVNTITQKGKPTEAGLTGPKRAHGARATGIDFAIVDI
jgi:hypothetical protein